ncbi:MAG: TfoX/Sxy family protein [Pyrinomonadaceae bacterium]|nr:TfoX/Sxy family protein [Pyrinomonadaceae bacterium]
MAYDEGLAERISRALDGRSDVVEKKMFGGLCFMVSGNMACGIVKDELMARVGPDRYDECLAEDHAREMDFTGRSLKGMIYVSPEGIDSDLELEKWVGRCINFVETLPAK